jgi:membrane-bound lytic murein transglycosylase D
MVLQPDGPLLRRVAYRTARGDTLAGVARRYRVAPADLAQWNKLGATAPLNAGQQLVIYVPSVTTKVARSGTRKRGAHATTGNVRGKVSVKAPAKSTVKAAGANRAGSRTAPRTASTTPPATR